MSKRTAEQLPKLSVFWLKKQGYLKSGYRSGSINWSCNGESHGSMGIATNLDDPLRGNYLNLRYTNTDYWSGAKSEMDYNIKLESTPCNYGDKRYWFICPLSRNGLYCGRRVGVIYSVGKWFGCRHCAYVAYSSQMRGGKYRGTSITYPDIEKRENGLRRYYYRGKPTRKYRRVIKMRHRLDDDFVTLAAIIGEKCRKVGFKLN